MATRGHCSHSCERSRNLCKLPTPCRLNSLWYHAPAVGEPGLPFTCTRHVGITVQPKSLKTSRNRSVSSSHSSVGVEFSGTLGEQAMESWADSEHTSRETEKHSKIPCKRLRCWTGIPPGIRCTWAQIQAGRRSRTSCWSLYKDFSELQFPPRTTGWEGTLWGRGQSLA